MSTAWSTPSTWCKGERQSVPQIALNWLLRKPTVSSVIIGARNEEPAQAEPEGGGLQLTESR